MTDTDEPNLARYLNPPRLPRVAPVVVLHLRADNDRNGNPRRCFVVLTTAGRIVSVIDEGYGGDAAVWASFPWYQHTVARRLGIDTSYAISVYVAPAEYRRWLKAGERAQEYATTGDLMPDQVKARALALRCAKWSAVRDALVSVRRHGAEAEWKQRRADAEGRTNHYAESDAHGVAVYHRPPEHGGDAVSDHLRRAMTAFMRAGMVRRVDTPPTATELRRRAQKRGENLSADAAKSRASHFARAMGQYTPTDTTPDLY